ncbi:MAG TPA: T9SS type A sorting domain-containing protein [Saprospiraceae bacterium]|nr:T9SS type A sorting domain-containing protein [Saprospiraceae bacterium]
MEKSLKPKLTYIIVLVSTISLFGQAKHDFQWVMNNYNWLDFRNDSVVSGILPDPNPNLNPGDYSTSICDSVGTLLFYTGGCYVLNAKNQIMMNGDSITGNWALQSWCGNNDFPFRMNNTIIPFPNSTNKYIIFNHNFVDLFDLSGPLPVPTHLYFHVVDMSLDNGLGGIIAKKQIAIEDTLSRGYLQAVRHANGVDWWVIDPKWNSNCYFVLPVTSNGVGTPYTECLGKVWDNNDWSGQTAFSSDGTKFARIEGLNGLLVFDFDNLNGHLSNPILLDYSQNEDYARGVVFSPNSRFLYVITQLKVYQFDLAAADIQSSLQLIGNIDEATIQAGQGYMGMAKLGPDGRIYISCSGSHKYLSVINKPNCSGEACAFRPYSIQLLANNYSGLPNLPHFAIQQSTYDCEISDLNDYFTDNNIGIVVYPNPSCGLVTISTQPLLEGCWRLMDGSNKIIRSGNLESPSTQIDLSKYNGGMYFVQLITVNGFVYTSRVILNH